MRLRRSCAILPRLALVVPMIITLVLGLNITLLLFLGVGGNEFIDSRTARQTSASSAFPAGVSTEVDNGPDPFFRDLEVNVAQDDGHEVPEAPPEIRTFTVDVYEVQSGGIGRRWRRIGWTYKVSRSRVGPTAGSGHHLHLPLPRSLWISLVVLLLVDCISLF